MKASRRRQLDQRRTFEILQFQQPGQICTSPTTIPTTTMYITITAHVLTGQVSVVYAYMSTVVLTSNITMLPLIRHRTCNRYVHGCVEKSHHRRGSNGSCSLRRVMTTLVAEACREVDSRLGCRSVMQKDFATPVVSIADGFVLPWKAAFGS